MKKILAILLSVCVILAYMPAMALAEGEPVITTVTLSSSSADYTGADITAPTVTVKDADGAVIDSDKYNVTWSSATIKNPGTYTATVEPADESVTGTGTATFTVNKLNPTNITATIAEQKVGAEVDYDSTTIKFKKGTTELTLVKDTDYTVDPASGTVALGSTNNVKIKYINTEIFTAEREVNVSYTGKFDISEYNFVAASAANPTEKTYAKGVKNTTTITATKKAGAPENYPATPTFTVTYSENEAYTGSSIKAKVTGTSSFMGQVENIETGITVVPKSLTAAGITCTVETSTDPMTVPAITVKDGSNVLVKDTDYTVTVAKANKITVTGQGNYKDGIDKSFTVGTEITDATLSAVSFTYTGYDQKPSITVKAGSVTVPSTGYRIDWPADVKKAETKTITIVGVGAYAGQISKTYTISPKSATNLDITIAGDTYQYSGRSIEPVVTVKDGTTTLVKNRDYTVTYDNNVSASLSPATAKVKMQGNYTGSKVLNFYIGKNTISGLTVSLDKDSYDYTGSDIRPTVTVKSGTTTVSSNNYVVSYKNNKAIGTGTVVITGKNDYYGTIEKTFSIVGKKISNCTVTLSPNTYAADGTQKKPIATVKYNTTTLRENTDYTVTYGENKTAGQGSVTITGKGGYEGTQTVYFTITGLDQKITTSSSSYTKYPTSDSFKIIPTANGDGTGFTFSTSDATVAAVATDGTVTITGIGKAKITVATVGDKKYTPATKTITITVKPKKVAIKSLTSTKQGKITVKYQKQPGGITGTQVRYSKKSDFSTYATYSSKGTNDTDATKIGTKTLTVKSGKTYYVKVRNYKTLEDGKKLYGSWSKVKKVTVL